MDISTVIEYSTYALLALGALIGGAIAILKIRAPKTETKADDKALAALEKANAVLDEVKQFVSTKSEDK
jgi:uncharacterized membrane-anchored protein YhcB (DUF1043 family)